MRTTRHLIEFTFLLGLVIGIGVETYHGRPWPLLLGPVLLFLVSPLLSREVFDQLWLFAYLVWRLMVNWVTLIVLLAIAFVGMLNLYALMGIVGLAAFWLCTVWYSLWILGADRFMRRNDKRTRNERL